MTTNFSTLVLVSFLHALVGAFPNKDQLRSEAVDVGGIWRMMEATGDRASDPQSLFYQVADEICWHDCHIASSSQSPCLEVYFAKLPRTSPLIQDKVARHSSDDTVRLVDLWTRQDALASILGVQHVCCGVYGLQAEVFMLCDAFQNCSFLFLEQQ
jgi:hypothetical protein